MVAVLLLLESGVGGSLVLRWDGFGCVGFADLPFCISFA